MKIRIHRDSMLHCSVVDKARSRIWIKVAYILQHLGKRGIVDAQSTAQLIVVLIANIVDIPIHSLIRQFRQMVAAHQRLELYEQTLTQIHGSNAGRIKRLDHVNHLLHLFLADVETLFGDNIV